MTSPWSSECENVKDFYGLYPGTILGTGVVTKRSGGVGGRGGG